MDLAPQGFSEELKSLPGVYAPPEGELLLAKRGDHVLGSIALKALEPQVAEIKRLFVRPQARKLGVGKALVAAILKTAVARGYREIKLDTLPDMASGHRALQILRLCGHPALRQPSLSGPGHLGAETAKK